MARDVLEKEKRVDLGESVMVDSDHVSYIRSAV